MVELSGEIALPSLIGGSVIELVTSGIYGDPRAIYREYLQNSVDAFHAFGDLPGRVEITIDPGTRQIRIRDVGNGLSRQDSVEALLPLARSKKRRGSESGFRGIGRLAGLVFAERIAFLTRTSEAHPVTRVTWNGTELRMRSRQEVAPETAIRESTMIEEIAGANYPANFFEVEISGVARHASSTILNTEAVTEYISETGPARISSEFPYVRDIHRLLEQHPNTVRPLDVSINGNESIRRPYSGGIAFSDNLFDPFSEFESFSIPCADSEETAAIGWVVHSSYIKAIPKALRIRGLRAREGNMQVGDESTFNHLFAEERFNRWCVGEVNIIDTRIVPDATRSYFEPGPHVRNLENHLSSIAAAISKRCRSASSMRNQVKRHRTKLKHYEELYELAVSGYLAHGDAVTLLSEALEELRDNYIDKSGDVGQRALIAEQQANIERCFSAFGDAMIDRSPDRQLSRQELQIYQTICHSLAVMLSSPRQAQEIIEAALAARKHC